ncbi:phage tail protein domain-containing protein [Micromonospora pattaloongensis]|uniref:Phage tail protein domain-containing protein n=1 Tax=Micromonospora pattaloongensis TaxID=405436 RepID=A0A1H3R7V1_9ACTN|nr:phage tail protein [Micromonospora pattaloongensis]SDZ21676.1 phage tail protein domain-containing protein [Micromonospora pattaloongensis]
MRGSVPGLVSPHPIGQQLPAMYLEDDFAQRFTAGLDEVLAPILLTLDCLDAYFDLALAPPDFLDWLAGWVAAPLDGDGPPEVRRELVRRAVEVHRWRGTARGVALAVRVATGATVEITDSGGVTWSATPTDAPPPDEVPEVRIRVPGYVDEALVRQVVASAVPAHVRVTLETQP